MGKPKIYTIRSFGIRHRLNSHRILLLMKNVLKVITHFENALSDILFCCKYSNNHLNKA